jgi:hypothetical protein
MARAAGIVLPAGETIRRWGTWWDAPAAYLDDVLIGAFLLVAAWKYARDPRVGQRYLAAAWGFGCGMGYLSLHSSLENIDATDVSGFPGIVAAAVKAAMVGLGVVCLIGTLHGEATAGTPTGRSETV